MRKIAIPMLVAALFIAGCGKDLIGKAQPKKHGEEAAAVKVVALKDVVPCFGCHDYDRYAAGKGKKFPHQKHRGEMGIKLHCNQCHDVKDMNGGKGHVATITKKNQPCSGCH
jgi:hypothetical protein